MLDLAQKFETAAKLLVEAQGAITAFAGFDDNDQVIPRCVIIARTATEFPQGSGNFTINVTVQVYSKADDTNVQEHRNLCASVIGKFNEDDFASQMSSQVDDFHCFGFSGRGGNEFIEDRARVTEFSFDAYCAGVALV